MRWLIVEDALRDKRGHWVEYVDTFRTGLAELGDQVSILADRQAETWLVKRLGCLPVLPPSIWHRMSDGANRLQRLARIPVHALATNRSLSRHLRNSTPVDMIFVPTVLVHHLVGWRRLIRGPLCKTSTRVLLFFPNTPVSFDSETGRVVLLPDPTGKLFRWLIRSLAPEVSTGKVILGAETEPMRRALEEVTGVPFVYLPHPVTGTRGAAATRDLGKRIRMAAYGPARHEKGSDLLQSAIKAHLKKNPATQTMFALQWLDDFRNGRGELIGRDTELLFDSRMEFITRFFGEGEYAQQLGLTDVLLLPYRANYALRVSRVVIEAMIHGIPVIATRGTTLAEQAEEFGAVVPCEDGSVDSLARAIAYAEANIDELRAKARERARTAAEHFSVGRFRQLLIQKAR